MRIDIYRTVHFACAQEDEGGGGEKKAATKAKNIDFLRCIAAERRTENGKF